LIIQKGEGEEIILNAGKEASEMIKKSEREGKRLPRNILKKNGKIKQRN
jgi:hypothetical protein